MPYDYDRYVYTTNINTAVATPMDYVRDYWQNNWEYPKEASLTDNYGKIITQKDLDDFAHKIYQIITEHVSLDISEEEFMNILNSR